MIYLQDEFRLICVNRMWRSASAGRRSSEVNEWPLLGELDPEVELPLLVDSVEKVGFRVFGTKFRECVILRINKFNALSNHILQKNAGDRFASTFQRIGRI